MSLQSLEALLGPARDQIIDEANAQYHQAYVEDLQLPGSGTVRLPDVLVWADADSDSLRRYINAERVEQQKKQQAARIAPAVIDLAA